MSSMTEKMSEASANVAMEEHHGRPQKGEHYRCSSCGMELEVTEDCRCQDPGKVHFYCCGQELQRA